MSTAEYHKDYYHLNSQTVLRNRHIRGIYGGLKKSLAKLNELKITQDDIDMTNPNINVITKQNLLLTAKKQQVQPVQPVQIQPVQIQPVQVKQKPQRPQRPSDILVKQAFDSLNVVSIKNVIDELSTKTSETVDKSKHKSEWNIAPKTLVNYKTRLNTLDRALTCKNNLKCLNDYNETITKLQAYVSPKTKQKLSSGTVLNIVASIVGMYKHSKLIESIIDKGTIKKYEEFVNKESEEVNRKQDDDVDYKSAVPWSKIQDLETKYKRGTFENLLTMFYIKMPYLRDDLNNVKIIYDPNENDGKNNFYDFDNVQLVLNKYKNSNVKGKREIQVPFVLHNLVKKSLKDFPRDFLFTHAGNTSKDKTYVSLSQLVKDTLGYTINDIRHSYATYLFKEQLGKKKITLNEYKDYIKQFSHSIGTHFKYVRQG